MSKSKSNKEEKEEPLEKKLWKTADKLRKNMDAAEYKHVVLGLIFLKLLKNSIKNLLNRKVKALILKTRTNIQQKKFFTFRHLQDGNGYRAEQHYQLSEKMLMMQWMQLKRIIQNL